MIEATLTFGRGGWSDAGLGQIPLWKYIDLTQRLRDKPDEEVRQELDLFVSEHFSQDDYAELSRIVDGWQEHFEDRQHIFADALWAHKRGYYTLSIPTLAAQIEGIVRRLTEEYRRSREWIMALNREFGLDYHPESPPDMPPPQQTLEWAKDLPLNQRYAKVEELRRYVTLLQVNELYRNGNFSDPSFNSSVNRHAILHGMFENFGELESLRLFFLVELLHDVIGDYKQRRELRLGSTENQNSLEAVGLSPHGPSLEQTAPSGSTSFSGRRSIPRLPYEQSGSPEGPRGNSP